ncbi:MAG: thioredoxin family protein [Betaproteobacteria bacterium]|nr:thioredoxin family protein [Betaproteobacteria bacterium]
MKVELLVSEWCPTCPQAERVWRQVADERAIDFSVLDMAQPEGRALAHRLRLKTIPAIAIDGTLIAVGVQSVEEARRMVAAAPAKARASPRHAGMLLSTDNRAFIVAAMIHLILAGLWLLAVGALLAEGALRLVGVHVFGAGFMLSLIYGLGAHMLPRFTGNPIRMGALPWVQLSALHGGLAVFALGSWLPEASVGLAGGALVWSSFLIFAGRLWPVLWPRPDRGVIRDA